MTEWRVHHLAETVSTNLDARAGVHGDVYTADFQSAGRGRLDHRWRSSPGRNLMMSAVLDVAAFPPEEVATLPLVVGLAVLRASARFLPVQSLALKWPNDLYLDGRKLAGILCEREGDRVIAGIGVNVGEREFPSEIAGRAVSFALAGAEGVTVEEVRNAVLDELDRCYGIWRGFGFAALWPELSGVDYLRGRNLAVLQTDDDAEPVCGLSCGILPDGSLDVGGVKVFAGEAHIQNVV